MYELLLHLQVFCYAAILIPLGFAEPDGRRIPKVYNALITSNQNLEPSKAFPVYQPVLTSAAIPFPYQSIFYGDLPLSNVSIDRFFQDLSITNWVTEFRSGDNIFNVFGYVEMYFHMMMIP